MRKPIKYSLAEVLIEAVIESKKSESYTLKLVNFLVKITLPGKKTFAITNQLLLLLVL